MNIVHGDRTIVLSAENAGYADDMDRHFDLFHSTVQASGGIADFSKPSYHRYLFDGKDYLTPSIPEESPEQTNYLKHYKPTGKELVFDCGAYSGVGTIYLAQRVGRVIAFEPDPMNRACLRANLKLHGITNVTVCREALAGHDGEQEFSSEGSLGSSIHGINGRSTFGKVLKVKTLSLESAIEKYGIPAFVKFDIESAELQVVALSLDLLKKHKISLAFDTNHWDGIRNTPTTHETIEFLLKACGYSVETNKDSGIGTTWGWKN